MFVKSSSTVFSKRVARPTFVGVNYAAGSTTLDSWWMNIAKAGLLPYVGLTVDKVGQTTGWTRGTVTQTCAAKVVEGAVKLCSDAVTGSRAGFGDSGSPVFYPEVSPDPLYALGILHTGGPIPQGQQICTNDCEYLFSSWSAIEVHLSRYFDYDSPAIGTVSIDGPGHVRAEDWCTWIATTGIERPEYEWKVNDDVEGSSQHFSRSFPPGFYGLHVRVWNYRGSAAANSMLVKSSSINPSVC
jgi:hypothetical protein